MFMGPFRELVGFLGSGNIPALLGLDAARSGETVSSIKDITPFEVIKYVSEPVVTIAVEPKFPRDLPKLIDTLRRISIEDPNLVVKINEETGEMLVAGMGVLHLEIATTLIQQAGLEIVSTEPLINYRETIRGSAGPVMSKSPNKHNRIFIKVEPLTPEIIELIRNNTINEQLDKKTVAKILREHGWDADEARNVVSVDNKGNIFVDATKGVQYMQESLDSIKIGFSDVMENGPLAQEACRGIKVILHHAEFHEDSAHRTYAQLLPASRRAILGAALLANPTLLEPILGIEVKGSSDLIGSIAGVISGRRGRMLDVQQKGILTIIEGVIPASETFDLSEAMRGATAGKAMWNTHFKEWNTVPQSLLPQLIASIRKRKGLNETPPTPDEFIDNE
jgi:elongation factor 2